MPSASCIRTACMRCWSEAISRELGASGANPRGDARSARAWPDVRSCWPKPTCSPGGGMPPTTGSRTKSSAACSSACWKGWASSPCTRRTTRRSSSRLMGTSCMLRWREAAERERVWIVDPGHPIVEGLDRRVFRDRAQRNVRRALRHSGARRAVRHQLVRRGRSLSQRLHLAARQRQSRLFQPRPRDLSRSITTPTSSGSSPTPSAGPPPAAASTSAKAATSPSRSARSPPSTWWMRVCTGRSDRDPFWHSYFFLRARLSFAGSTSRFVTSNRSRMAMRSSG